MKENGLKHLEKLGEMAVSNLVSKYDWYFENIAVKLGPVEDDDEQ